MLKHETERFVEAVEKMEVRTKNLFMKSDCVKYIDGETFEYVRDMFELLHVSTDLTKALSHELTKQTEILTRIEHEISKC